MKKAVAVLLAVLLLVACVSCGSRGIEGKWLFEDEIDGFTITFFKDGTYLYESTDEYGGIASGRWTTDGDVLTLDGKNSTPYSLKGDRLTASFGGDPITLKRVNE